MKDRESRLLLAEDSKIIFMLPEQSEQPSKVLEKKRTFENRYKAHFKQAPLKGKNLRRRGTQGEFG